MLTLQKFLEQEKNNRVLKEDIDAFINGDQKAEASADQPKEEAKATTTPAAKPEGEYPETREKMSGIRKAIANAMVNSKHKAPHVTLHDEVDVTALVAHRKKIQACCSRARN